MQSTSPEQKRPRVVVLVRAHFASEKLLDLLRMLKDGVGYDLYVCADQTQGPLNLSGEPVLAHSAEMCGDLGLVRSLPDSPLLWYFGDYALYCAYHSIPAYDYYVMIEYDVEFVRGNVYALESLISRMSSPGGYDLIATHYGPRGRDWGWGPTCEGRFSDFYGVFFPLVVLSQRALRYLYDWRRCEAASPPDSGRYVFCEAFVPSALMAAGAYRCADLDSLLPGSWDHTSFRTTPPMLLGALPLLNRRIEFVHPVYSEREYLQSELHTARHDNTIAEFTALLRDPGPLPLSQEARNVFLDHLAEEAALKDPAPVRRRTRKKASSRTTGG